ncbi:MULTISPECIES: LuxR family transcriptional regulator [Microbacterium]|uniref:LuxR family transcriptional regulator n=1 Tax=Microbacterium TaxID=33882 RepID=UPI002783FA5B|nr:MULTISPECIES: LuxR family transcriptional regulator [Microbacterium]MDQ1074299.1 LuxR family maltose regulon positive regulatory protein [Microbacterium sp. SORGH_AS_0969]MDQ1114527.1 LuxR family maltose regulon positive regulatory protein [Microbacterium testaceum]
MLIDLDTSPSLARASRRASRFWTPRCDTVTTLKDAVTSDVVLLRGPARVGKTSLLRQFATALVDDPDIGVQLIDAAQITPERFERVSAAFQEGPAQHVLLVDNLTDKQGVTSEQILDLLRADGDLRVVAATRHVTRLESPLVTLEFDVHVVPPADLLMSRAELALVFELNGVEITDAALDVVMARTHGWPALAQLVSSRLRLEGLSLRSRDEAEAIAEHASRSLTGDMEQHLTTPITDDLRLLAVAPFINVELAEAIGIDSTTATAQQLLSELQDAGFVWPSSTRLVLAEPVRAQWLREIETRRPAEVDRARVRLLEHLVATGEPLRAAQLAADAGQWTTLASVLRSSGPEVWSRDADGFRSLISALRSHGGSDPIVVDTLLRLDPETVTSSETPVAVISALSKLPEAKAAAHGRIEALLLRVSLLRAAGRFALATESAALLVDALRRRQDLAADIVTEGWYQVGMTHFAMGKLRDASLAIGQVERMAPPAQKMRARGVLAVIALLEGDVRAAESRIATARTDGWVDTPWGESLRLASAWLSLEHGDALEARTILESVPATASARELWPYAAATQALAFLLSGAAPDALGMLRSWGVRARSTPPSHFQSTQMLTARAKVLIALRQARKALALFEGPFGLSSATAPAIALSQLYAGRAHEAYVMSVKWGIHQESSPRASLESMVVSIVADIRLNGSAAQRSTVQRAEAISIRNDLWTPWSAVAPEDRAMVLSALSSGAREKVLTRDSFFASSVSVPHLTKREQVVLAQLTPEATIVDIARILVVSPNTVKTQLQSLYRKLGVSDRASAIRAAHAWGLIESENEG